MAEGEDWLMRPVVKGMIRYESLIDGRVSLLDIAICNEALDVIDENAATVNRLQQQRKKNG